MSNTAFPRHVAIIMDGNGRWAEKRGMERKAGHVKGADALRQIIPEAMALGIEVLTVYAFSTENWSRPEVEVIGLMALAERFAKMEVRRLHWAGVRIRVIGDRSGLRENLRQQISRMEALTRNNKKFTLVIAFNYGGRDEIARAVRKIAEKVLSHEIESNAIDPNMVSDNLDTASLPDPDLMIRTGGEERISNFLLWQSAYAEFIFTNVLWPDFGPEELKKAIEEYARRERRFGAILTGAAP